MISKKTLIAVISAVAAAVFAVGTSAAFTGCNKKTEESSQVADVLEPVVEEPTEPEMPDITNLSAGNGLTGRAKVLLRENEDVVGYIKVNDTYIDYPVVQYDGDELKTNGNDYYLHKDLYGNYLERGTIFMDYRDNFEADESKQSENIVLYGHNMNNGSMFANLHKYRTDDTFYEKNPIIYFSSNYKDYKYIIFSYFITSGDIGPSAYGEEFDYWNMEDLSDKKDFDRYLELCAARSYIDPDIDVSHGDKLLTLSTCYLDSDNSRLVVVARRLRDHETMDNIDKKGVNNAGNADSNTNTDDGSEQATEPDEQSSEEQN